MLEAGRSVHGKVFVTVALVYPPTCDPTAPYIAVPILTACLREAGIDVLPIDANVEAWDDLLSEARLNALRDRIDGRLSALEGRKLLDHGGQLEYSALCRVYAEAHAIPRLVDEAKRVMRDADAFFDTERYGDAVATIEAATRVVSAAYHPLAIDFTTYRTPFGLLSPENARAEATRKRNPFFEYIERILVPRLTKADPIAIGISMCFPGQLQPAYALAYQLRARFPRAHLVAGGPGLTQILSRLRGPALARALGPFDSAILYEGEDALLSLIRALESGDDMTSVPNLVSRGGAAPQPRRARSVAELPAPDFSGMPLERYFAPFLVLPYDPTRGCYWGKCAFCHYGLTAVGTAKYRERPMVAITEHLRQLSEGYGTRYFHLSQDSVAPKTAVRLAGALSDAKLDLGWCTDIRPEPYLTLERAKLLASAGAVACALGVESGDERILSLIDKGISVAEVSAVIDDMAAAGIAVEAMCFTDFPTETRKEALRTLTFLRDHADRLGSFIVGEFGLTHGSRVACEPEAFGLAETWLLRGDELGLAILHEEAQPPKTDADREAVDDALRKLSRGWRLRAYPWAGAISTAHSLLYYDRYGPGVFRKLSSSRGGRIQEPVPVVRRLKFDVHAAGRAADEEAAIWSHLVHEARAVSRALYDELAAVLSPLHPSPNEYRFAIAQAPLRVARQVRRARRRGGPPTRRR